MVLLGDNGVGKTSLITRFVDGTFNEKYRATLGATFSTKDVIVENYNVRMSIWDLAGQLLFRELIKEYGKGTEGAFIVCDATKVATLWNLRSWIKYLEEVAEDVPFILIVNKIDLKDRRNEWQDHLEKLITNKYATILYTSAKTGENVEEAFTQLARMMVKKMEDEEGG